MSSVFRYYQKEADYAIYEELLMNNKCIVKMFCGTGKSLLMRRCKMIEDRKLVVFVFPSLSLIDQFYSDYLYEHSPEHILIISSETDATTDSTEIISFLSNPNDKIICITYQSFKTLIDNLGELKINVCIFDEAHHAVGETYQKLIFENDVCEKQIFFTATPKNANGIVMYDREHKEDGMCGKLVYDYSYLRGMNEGYLNPFEIRIDMYTENTNKSVYESIARAVLVSGNSRVLTFHSDVNTDRDTSVNNFVNNAVFKRVFKEIQKKEFPEIKKYKKITMIGLTANDSGKQRKQILDAFDTTPDNEVIIISSCETIGEGIDTKNANMCVFVDPKSSYVKIIQNIGRIVRKVLNVDKPKSTILIPCWIDKTKYLECNGDKEKCDEVIRRDMSEGGNFNGILNVLSALKQEDEDIYEICIHYPDSYAPQEIKSNLEKQGYTIGEIVGDGMLMETIEYLLDTELDYENYEYCETTEEMIMEIAEENDVCIEIHTNSLENPVERYHSECETGEVIRLYKNVNLDEENEENVYQPIIKKEQNRKRNADVVHGPSRKNKLGVNVHINPDIKVLWNITSESDFTKDICSCVIDCEVVDKWYDNFELLKKFIKNHKRLPSQCSKKEVNEETEQEKQNRENEKKLASWLQSQRNNYKQKINAMKDSVKYNLWTSFLEEYKEYFISKDDVWNDKFTELQDFMDKSKTKKRPNTKSKDLIEKKLGYWLVDQLIDYRNVPHTMLNDSRYNKWKTFMEKYNVSVMNDDEMWNYKFTLLKKFVKDNGMLPSKKKNEENEKLLGNWLSNQQHHYKNKYSGMKNELRYNLWSTFVEEYKEYFKTDDEVWYEIFEEVKKYIYENKRKPRQGLKYGTEAKIGNWVQTQQQNYKKKEYGMKDPEKYDLWTSFLEEYQEYFKPDDEVWYEIFETLKIFINKNKKRPNSTSKNKTEKILGCWVQTQQQNYKKDAMKDTQRYDLWTSFLEEYKIYFKTDDEVWYETFEEVKKYIDENKKRPSQTSKDETEKELGTWIGSQQTNYNKKVKAMKDPEKYDLWTSFLEEYKIYFKTDDEVWYETFEEVKKYIDENKKRPSQTSNDEIEKKLGSWTNNQQNKYKKKEQAMKDPEKYNLWTSFLEKYKEYFKTYDEVWQEKFEEVKKYIDENKKRPSDHSKDETVKKLGSWLSHQQQNYKKKEQAMKDPEKYNLWTEFLIKYKEYFDNQSSETESTTSSSTTETTPMQETSPKTTIKRKKSMKLISPSTKSTAETPERKRERVKSEISILHQKYKTMKSDNLHKEMTEQPTLWHAYHEISEENEKSFPEHEIPRNRIITELNKIKTKRTKLVVDMGCGKGQISTYFSKDKRFQFTNYDHVACNETVISCDISQIPLEEDTVEICILSLAMWGSNCKDYVKEANRILESGGKLYIIEPTKRWSEQDENGNMIPEKEGCKMKSLLEENGFQIVEQSIEKFCMFVCIKI